MATMLTVVKEFKKNNCDGVIAFGGGSGLDKLGAIVFMSVKQTNLGF